MANHCDQVSWSYQIPMRRTCAALNLEKHRGVDGRKRVACLRSINGLVDNKEDVEGIIDPGSQIISMSEEVCHALGLIYDPTICLNMQSANGEVDQSLGLVRNVPFQVSDIVLYLQITLFDRRIRHLTRRPFVF
ncbi:hypothetical protein A0H81_01163 [Grifola frondosa]|uniref:Aspartic peptidase DDI1-type domain-containing protein n=1 Tax=Grifola frondosa TaxID=5627 RepID=A0A1C7MPY7_GRIFR|nr:hypothetical protein A0H81_01163 [Grifola frondosa]